MLHGDDVHLTDRILACAIEVHRHLGPWLVESIYESAICMEFSAAGLLFTRQIGVPLYYRSAPLLQGNANLGASTRLGR